MKNIDNKVKFIAKLNLIVFLICFVLTAISIMKNDKIIGFAIDEDRKIYVGKNSVIEVYNNGKLENTIKSVTNRGYTFTIRNEKIVIFTGAKLYYLDLNGNMINYENFTGIVTKELRNLGKTFEDSQGNYFQLKKSFGRSQIVENGSKIIFQESLGNYIFNCALLLIWFLFILLSLPVLVTIILNKYKRRI